MKEGDSARQWDKRDTLGIQEPERPVAFFDRIDNHTGWS